MPWSEDQLNEALLKAHEAGDTSSAKLLTREILRVRAADPERKRVEELRSKYEYGYKNPVPTGEGVARSLFQGNSYGLGDEAAAAVGATIQPITGQGDTGMSWKDRYNAYVERERQKLGQFRQERPVLAAGSEIAGAIPTAMAIPSPGAATTVVGNVAMRGAEAGLHGAAYGFNAGEGGVASRLANAGKTAAVAAPFGAAVPLIGQGIRSGVNYLGEGSAARQMGMNRPEYNVLRQATAETPAMAGAGVQNIQRGGRRAMLVDAGTGARQVLDTAIQKGGPGGRTASDAVTQRVTQASADVNTAMDQAFGRPAGIRRTTTALRRGTAAARGDAYDAAYARPIDYSSDIGRNIEEMITTRVPQSAINAANRLMRVELGRGSRQIIARVGDDGTVTYQRMPDVQQIDYITRGLNEVADAADSKGKLGGTTQTGRAYGNLARDLRNATRTAVPEYGTALRTAAHPIQARQALDIGSRALSPKVTRDAFEEQVANLTEAQRTFAAQGIRSQIDDAMANVQLAFSDPNMDAREAAKALKILSSRAAREKTAILIGEDAANNLFRQLDEATTAFELRAGVVENSKTAMRLMTDDAIKRQTEGGVINKFRNMEGFLGVGETGKEVGRIAMGRSPAAKRQIEDSVYRALAERLTGLRGQNAVRFLQELQRLNQAPPLAGTANVGERLANALRPAAAPAAVQALPANDREKLARLLGSQGSGR